MLLLPFTMSVISLGSGRSHLSTTATSYVTTQENNELLGHVIASHMTKNLTACSQQCLSNKVCVSFNYRKEGVCQLNDRDSREVDLKWLEGSTFGEWVEVQIEQFTFTTLGARGVSGPSKSQLGGYTGTSLDGKVDIINGIQCWRVPTSGTYIIDALGASGGNGTCHGCNVWKLGGLGARIKGRFRFDRGTQLTILVGQQGLPMKDFAEQPGGGGGGTFVAYADNTAIIIAGGGGGGGVPQPNYGDGDPGQAAQNGSRHGGVSGTGGWRFNTWNETFDLSGDIKASTGAGYKGDGDSGKLGHPAISFLSGGTGGFFHAYKIGGFGGGGFGLTHGGGGGGYSGGGIAGTKSSGTAGGGGSYNSGSSQTNEAGVNEGDGKVIITLVI